MKISVVSVFAIVLIACTHENTESKTENTVDTTSAHSIELVKEAAEEKDVITQACAIIVYPTDNRIDSLKKINEEDFYTIADDYQFYMAEARNILDSNKTTVVEKQSTGNIKFKTNDGKNFNIDLSEFYWGVILFDGKTEPRETDITVFAAEFKLYMQQEGFYNLPDPDTSAYGKHSN